MTAALLAGLGMHACRQRPEPAFAMHAGDAKIGQVVRKALPRQTLPIRQATALISEPEACRGTFGAAIACAGSTVVVGAPKAGASGKVWVYDAAHLEAAPTCLMPNQGAKDERFGSAVAISPQGDLIAVGSPRATIEGNREIGRVDLWRRAEGGWVHDRTFVDPDTSSEHQHFGASVALDEECLIIGAPDASMTVVDDVLETRVRRPRPEPGSTAEAPEAIVETVEVPTIRQHFIREGAVLVWQRDKQGAWKGPIYSFLTRGRPMARFGTAIANAGTQTVVSAPPQMTKYGLEGGTISVFIRRPGAPWRAEANALIAPIEAEASDLFGSSVATAPGLAVAGIPNGNIDAAVDVGRVVVMQQDVGTRLWVEGEPIQSPAPQIGSHFGASVVVWGDLLLAGQPDSTSDTGSGHVFAFRKRPGIGGSLRSTWDAVEEWAAPPLAQIRRFGGAIASSTQWIAIAAPGEAADKGHVVLFAESGVSPKAAPSEAPASEAPGKPPVLETVPETQAKPPFETPPSEAGSSL
jgi:hypothetical protein